MTVPFAFIIIIKFQYILCYYQTALQTLRAFHFYMRMQKCIISLKPVQTAIKVIKMVGWLIFMCSKADLGGQWDQICSFFSVNLI